jgi:hypothetical protein
MEGLSLSISLGASPPDPYESDNADFSGDVDIDDVVYLIAYIFPVATRHAILMVTKCRTAENIL